MEPPHEHDEPVPADSREWTCIHFLPHRFREPLNVFVMPGPCSPDVPRPSIHQSRVFCQIAGRSLAEHTLSGRCNDHGVDEESYRYGKQQSAEAGDHGPGRRLSGCADRHVEKESS